ncbi:MAG: ABC transporter ATP-binding protein [Holosporales bacterium]|nr:ABC transporter ATP-binding protein [Holosporales bacterium]
MNSSQISNQKGELEAGVGVAQEIEANPYVVINNISKYFSGTAVVKNVSFTVSSGELFSILGESGCGKTTLLRILAGFEKPTSGSVIIDGVDITDWPPHERPVNLMFQSYALFPHMDVYQNIAFGLRQDGVSKAAIDAGVEEAISLVQLSGLENRKPDELSGGQKQRVALARSLAKKPKLLLLDEPMAALDKRLRDKTQFELIDIQERVGITFILVTHDQREAMTISTRIGVMDDGRIRQIGTAHDIYEFPNSKYVAEFIGEINIFDGVVAESKVDYALIKSQEANCYFYVVHTGAIPIGTTVSLAIRPEKVMISTVRPTYPRNWTQGVVKEVAYLGNVSAYYVKLESGKIIKATLPNLFRIIGRNIMWGDVVYVFWRAENSVVLTS